MAIEMIAIIVAFTFGGRFLDSTFQFKFPLFTLMLSLAGIGIALYQVLRKL